MESANWKSSAHHLHKSEGKEGKGGGKGALFPSMFLPYPPLFKLGKGKRRGRRDSKIRRFLDLFPSIIYIPREGKKKEGKYGGRGYHCFRPAITHYSPTRPRGGKDWSCRRRGQSECGQRCTGKGGEEMACPANPTSEGGRGKKSTLKTPPPG